jgi:hypothetical protein
MTLELISDEAGGLGTTGACRCSRGIVAKGDYARGSVRIQQVCLDKKAVTGVDDIKIYCERREAARGYTSGTTVVVYKTLPEFNASFPNSTNLEWIRNELLSAPTVTSSVH